MGLLSSVCKGCNKELGPGRELRDANGNVFCVLCYDRYGKSPSMGWGQGEDGVVFSAEDRRRDGKELLLG